MEKVDTANQLSPDDLALLLERTIRLTLSPTAFLMMITYAGLAIAHVFVLQPPASIAMTALATTTSLLCGWVWRSVATSNHRHLSAHDQLGVLALAALANIATHMVLLGDQLQTTYFAICMLGCGFMMLNRKWFIATLTAYLVVWILVYHSLPRIENSYHYEFMIGVTSIISVAVHVTRFRTTTEAERLRITANRQREEAEANLRHASRLITMGELVASIAHELNQPLSAISNYVAAGKIQLTAADCNQANVRLHLDKIGDTALRAGEVIKRIRRLASNTTSSRSEIDLNHVIREAVTVMSTSLQHQDVNLCMKLADSLPIVLGDEIQLQQVIINLVQNGVESLRSSNTPNAELVLRTFSGEDGPLVTVSDNGPGIRIDPSHSVFDPFFTTKPNGMGMGLAICRTIVEKHGGSIWCQTPPNANSQTDFSFSIPSSDGPTL